MRAKVLARRGDLEGAEELAREALALVAPTELLGTHADVLMDLAGILEDAGRGEDAREALEEAADMYRRKGILVRLAEAERQAHRLATTRA